jgi:hypothetical protein
MSTDVLEVRRDVAGPRRMPAIAVLGRKEAWRMLTSPAIPLLLGYLVVVLGVDVITGGGDSTQLSRRAQLAEMSAYVVLLFWGPLTFVAAHLVATSSRRSGSERLLLASPVDRRRRDIGLCLGVVLGPVLAALALTALSAWLATGTEFTVDSGDVRWSWVDVAQVPAIVLGAGILGIVFARWVYFPGSLLIGFVALVIGTGWLMSGSPEVRPWLAPYVAIEWWADDGALRGSPGWHLVYLLGLSALGVCVVALRQPERRTRWLYAGAGAVFVVVTAGLLQLPALN